MPTSQAERSRRLRHRLTIRTRLTLSYAGLVTGCGAVLIAIVYLYMRYVPSYHIVDISESAPGSPSTPSGVARPSDAVEITSVSDFLDTLLVASVIALIVLAVVGGTVGWIVAGRIIKPLAAINDAATRAATGALDHRVGLGGPKDEIRDLSDTFDRMLASLERSFAAHRRFAANASHELRTPLATTKTMIDVALADPDADAEGLRSLAERVREVNRSNIETIDSLLDLANVYNGTLAHEPIDLPEITDAVIGELADEAESAGVTLAAVTGKATAVGNPVLVRQAISNLVRNAIRHNRPGGHAAIGLSTTGTGTRVTVTNTGELIGQETADALVEPFVRGSGRTLTRRSGHGLGLAIVATIAAAHDGTLTLAPNPEGGLTVHFELPRIPART
ncbi:HAMP domain-containing sensor histidine kinase [Saccharomonospora sp. NPDC046836]|uniref:sensor histidine kinase n=1 Tax=Saccharomonospora sp. NPDC046836 TaxID=3156921 RepID=UPI0033D42E9B